MNTNDLVDILDKVLPDARITQDLADILNNLSAAGKGVELSEAIILIPKQTYLEVVTKAFFKENYRIAFDTGYRVQVAIGGVRKEESGILFPEYCFATLYYNEGRSLVTVDFHEDMR